jgi:mannose-6-phosphate isomerase-like protein (cupin superfamily)/DNA-binding XRE family transcriptional regulator
LNENILGQRLRQLRTDHDLTLMEVSNRCGVAISTLSKIENGQVSPVYGTLRKIAVGLGIAFEQLISDHGQNHPRPYKVVTRSAQTADVRNARYGYGMHAANLASKAMLPIVMTIESREPPGEGDWSSHAGEEFLLVIEGCVDVHLEHDEAVRLERGDSLYIDSRVPHGFVKVGRGKARLVSVSYDPSQAANRATAVDTEGKS